MTQASHDPATGIKRHSRRGGRAHHQVPLFVACIVGFAVLLIGSSWIAWRTEQDKRMQRAAYERAVAVVRTADLIEIATLNMVRGQRGYLLTSNPRYLEPHRDGSKDLAAAVDRLETLTEGEVDQGNRFQELDAESRALTILLDRTIALERAGRHAEAIADFRTGDTREAINRISAELDGIRSVEGIRIAVLAQRLAVTRGNHLNFLVLTMFAGFALLAFATYFILALRRAFARERRYREELRRLANTDELTGIANRRELVGALNRAIAAARRAEGQLAFAIIDIDHFKRVNDSYGHAAGDEVIRKVARATLATVRGCDIVGRIGGEEFAIVLPGASLADAYGVCERVRDRVNNEVIELSGGQALSVTISTGIARLSPEDTQQTLMARADDALYEAKHGGRDQVRLAA